MVLIDSLLVKYGMRWETSPYRIINKHGVIVQKQNFDVREVTLKAQENLGFLRDKFNKTYPNT